MEGRPFALLGVNCDTEKETLQQVSFRQELNWQNWWNGGSSGPFTARYGVNSWPTTLVLDANGVVRYRGRPGPEMEQAVEKLVRETEKGRG
jgi:hypothetical protein